jgi:NAD(P)H dehydrogenase (quinone)
MYAITGITGQVGGAMARTLLAAGQPVRAVLRDAGKAPAWAATGVEDAAVADMTDAAALTVAFTGVDGVFILPPSDFDPEPGFPSARAVIAAVKAALLAARPGKVVCLSTIGAQAAQSNLLTQRTLMEQALRDLPMPVTLLWPAWFMENFMWDVASARDGMIASFLQPLDKPVPMIATEDVGRVAAELIRQDWSGCRIVELEAAHRITAHEVGATFAKVLGRPVRIEAVPRDSWGSLFRSQGMKDPMPRIQMLDGFNEGWIEFERGEQGSVKGRITLEAVLRRLVEAG